MKNTITKTITSIAILLSTLIVGCGPSKPTLNIYTWSDYIDADLIQKFEKTYNCSIIMDTFDSNEAMFSKIKAGARGYDIIVPTSYMAKIMDEHKLLEKLDLSKIPNAQFIDKQYLTNLAFDKKMEYSVPYMLGYTCIAYNKEKVKNVDNSWNIFSRADLKGRMTMLDDFRETIGAGLMYTGADINCIDSVALENAKNQIIEWKKNLAKLDNEVYKNGITSGEFWVVQGYSGDLLQAIVEAKYIDIIIPREGVSISCDDLVILNTAPNKELAYKFINFIIEPKNAAKNMEYTQFFAPVPEAKKYVKDVDTERLFPSNLYKSGQLIKDLGNNNKKFQNVWEDIKSSK